MNYLIINGHKYYPFSQGKLNMTLFEKIKEILSAKNAIKTSIIENGYNIEEETEKFKWADIIIFQTPMNWFSVPWLLKKYIDEVYQYGIFYAQSKNYGEGGLFINKKYMYSMTCNIPENVFNNPNTFFNGKSSEDVISSLHLLQKYSGMLPIKSFFCFDVVHNPDINSYLKNIEQHIKKYCLNKNTQQ